MTEGRIASGGLELLCMVVVVVVVGLHLHAGGVAERRGRAEDDWSATL